MLALKRLFCLAQRFILATWGSSKPNIRYSRDSFWSMFVRVAPYGAGIMESTRLEFGFHFFLVVTPRVIDHEGQRHRWHQASKTKTGKPHAANFERSIHIMRNFVMTNAHPPGGRHSCRPGIRLLCPSNFESLATEIAAQTTKNGKRSNVKC